MTHVILLNTFSFSFLSWCSLDETEPAVDWLHSVDPTNTSAHLSYTQKVAAPQWIMGDQINSSFEYVSGYRFLVLGGFVCSPTANRYSNDLKLTEKRQI